MSNSILYLTIKKRWFDMIAAGIKKEEYRKIKPYWNKRLNKHYDFIKFTNGYRRKAPSIEVELKEICRGLGIIEWGALENEHVHILKLGNVIKPPETKEKT